MPQGDLPCTKMDLGKRSRGWRKVEKGVTTPHTRGVKTAKVMVQPHPWEDFDTLVNSDAGGRDDGG